MEFYFCESCGRRVTNEDIDLGLARNKQVKGVYCGKCSDGVTTIEFEAISAKTLNDSVSKNPERPEPSIERPEHSKPGQSNRPVPLKPKKFDNKRKSPQALWGLIAGIGFVVCTIAFVLQSARKPQSSSVASISEGPRSSSSGALSVTRESRNEALPAASSSPEIRREPRATEMATGRPIRIEHTDSRSETVVSQVSQSQAAVQNPKDLHDLKDQDAVASVDSGRETSKPISESSNAPTNGEVTVTLQPGAPVAAFNLEKYAGARMNSIYPTTHPKPTAEPIKDVCKVGEVGWYPFVYFAVFDREEGVLPENAEILEAKLFIYKVNDYPTTFSLRRVSAEWKEDEVNWSLAQRGKSWSAPGGDVHERVSAVAKALGKPCWCTFDVSSDLREFQSTKLNFGWRIEAESRSSIIRVASAVFADPSLRPKLLLRFRLKQSQAK